MALIRLNGPLLFGTPEDDTVQGYNAPGAPGDPGTNQLLTGFASPSLGLYGISIDPLTGAATGYTETRTEDADGNDAILGGLGNDVLVGGGGNDTLIGGAQGSLFNNDYLYGGWGNDLLIAGNGAQTTDGGNDSLVGGPGNDVLNGMDGNDILEGDVGDPLNWDNGIDVAVYSKARTDYDIAPVNGKWIVTDLETFEVDTLSSIEYLFFNTPIAPNWITPLAPTPRADDAKVRIDAFKSDPDSQPDVYRLPTLYLDFDATPPKATPKTVYNPTTKEWEEVLDTIGGGDGSLSIFASYDQGQRDAIAAEVQKIFNQTDIRVLVVAEEPPLGDEADKLVFSSDTIGRLQGIAPWHADGVDRFNVHHDDEGVIFYNSTNGLSDLNVFYETIAHEAAHMYGLRHVNPYSTPHEVMDYEDSSAPQFVREPVRIIEKPEPGGVVDPFFDHNPTYHLRRYFVGDSHETLASEGIVPGNWETEGFLIAAYTLSFGSLAKNLRDLKILFVGNESFAGGGSDEFVGRARTLAAEITSNDSVTFSVAEGQRFWIVASTEGGETLDITLSFTTPTGISHELVGGADFDGAGTRSLTASILSYSSGGAPVDLGSAGIDLRSVETVSPDGGQPDSDGPTVTIDQAPSQADPTDAGTVVFRVVFSEAVTGFGSDDVVLSGTAGATTAVVSGSGASYTVAVSGMTQAGTVLASVAAGAVSDAAGNPSLASTSVDNMIEYLVSGTVPITGTDRGETLRGTAADEVFLPLKGTDTVKAGRGDDLILASEKDGVDIYFGDAGGDTVDYSAVSSSVTVLLGKLFGLGVGIATGKAIGVDTLTSIENVIGSRTGDVIKGNGLANRIEGGAGNDTMAGGGYPDVFVFRAGFGGDTILDFDAIAADGQDLLDISRLGITAADFADAVEIRTAGGRTTIAIEDGGSLVLLGVTGRGGNVIDGDDFLLA